MKDTMTSREVADFLGVTIKSVQHWEREGRLAPDRRTPTKVHCFSSRLRGLQNYRKNLDEAFKSEVQP